MQRDGMVGETGGTRRRVRLFSVIVPLVGLALLYPLRLWLLAIWPAAADAVVGLLMGLGVLVFSWAVFGVIDRQDRILAQQHGQLRHRYKVERRLRAQLETVHEAALVIASARTAAEMLQRLVDLSRDLIGARYAALRVLDDQRAGDTFYTAGLSPEERAALPRLPDGHSLLTDTMSGGTAVHLPAIMRAPQPAGVPAGQAEMSSVLDVPVAHGETVVGTLYLGDKAGAAEFSAEDKRLLGLLAGHAAVVIENARLAGQVAHLAIVADRQRIGRELHDGVIQAIYAVNLELEDTSEDIESNPDAVRQRLDMVIDRLGEVIKEIRRSILGLQPERATGQPLPVALATLLSEARAHTLLETDLRVDAQAWHDVPPELAGELVQMAREGLANVVRHARASHLWVTLERTEATVHLCIRDDGIGFDAGQPALEGHYGLHNLARRAESLEGTMRVQSAPGQGTTLTVRAPLGAVEREEAHA